MSECKASILVALPAVMLIIFAVGGVHILRMEQLYKDVKDLEVIDRQIFYLDTKIEQLRQTIAPVVLRNFSVRNTTGGVELLYRDKVVWKGDPRELNTTYEVEYFGKVILTHRDGRGDGHDRGRRFQVRAKGRSRIRCRSTSSTTS